MKNLVNVIIILSVALVAIVCVPAAVAQTNNDNGRPDPTGQGRYTEFGREVLYQNARVIKSLPAGAQCNPAGEMVGPRVWNSTRDGHAISAELSDKAEVAVTSDSRIFLCHCARGFNELFLVNSNSSVPASTPAPSVSQQVVQATAPNIIVIQSPPVTATATNYGGGGSTPASSNYDNTPGAEPSYGCGTNGVMCQYDTCGQVIFVGVYGNFHRVPVMQVCGEGGGMGMEFNLNGRHDRGEDRGGYRRQPEPPRQRRSQPTPVSPPTGGGSSGGTLPPSNGRSGSTGGSSGGGTSNPTARNGATRSLGSFSGGGRSSGGRGGGHR